MAAGSDEIFLIFTPNAGVVVGSHSSLKSGFPTDWKSEKNEESDGKTSVHKNFGAARPILISKAELSITTCEPGR